MNEVTFQAWWLELGHLFLGVTVQLTTEDK